MKVILKATLSLLILVVAASAARYFYMNKPRPVKVRPDRATPLVQAITVHPSTEPVFFETSGTVVPARKIVVRSEVEGRVVEQNEKLVSGGILKEGELLIRLDARDYQLQVRERRAELTTAEYELAVEQGRQIVARREWRILAEEKGKINGNKDLILRKPHLRHFQARVVGAKARLAAAELAEERTNIRSPGNGIVLDEEVERGQLIGRHEIIATLVAIESFQVQVSVPLFLLEHIQVPEQDSQQGSKAQIILDRGQGAQPVVRQGTLFKVLADLDPKGRMARLLVTLPDPLALRTEKAANRNGNESSGTILLGSFVRVRIAAGQLENIFVLPEKALREGNRVWLVNADGVLSFRKATVVWRRTNEVLVDVKILPDEKVIVSRLSSPVPGMRVREEEQANLTI